MSERRKPNQVDLTLDDGSKCTIYGDMKAIQQIFHGYVKSIATEETPKKAKKARKEAAQ